MGQVPFEATEADLWSIFSTVGTILELVVLRTPQGKSKGCAFVTYESRWVHTRAGAASLTCMLGVGVC